MPLDLLDKDGSNSLCFFLAMYTTLFMPAMFCLMWPEALLPEKVEIQSQLDMHGRSKWFKQKQKDLRKKRFKMVIQKAILSLCVFVFFWLVFKASEIEGDHLDFDPYDILGVNGTANKTELTKAYRNLARTHHPDKGGDPEQFIRIRKAYDALTDDEIMQNWLIHYHPDGPRAKKFGIALPQWLVVEPYSYVVLCVYFLHLFLPVLPVGIPVLLIHLASPYDKTSEVLRDTVQLYYFFINKMPNMNLKRVLMVLSASFEFSPDHKSEIKHSKDDNEEIPKLINTLENYFGIIENSDERPFKFSYSVKARILIHSHLCRLQITSAVIQKDIDYILCKSLILIQEMVTCIAQLTTMAHWNKANLPRLETLENAMKLAPMIVQGLRETESPLLQLPYFNSEYVQLCHDHQPMSNLQSLVELRKTERRRILKGMRDVEYETMLRVLYYFPSVSLDVKAIVKDEEQPDIITLNDIVTIVVLMKRTCLGDALEHRNNNEENEMHTQMNCNQRCTVYAPFMPVKKVEKWWLYVCDRVNHVFVTSPILVTNLQENKELELNFPAPNTPGHFVYTVCLRSDSYLGRDQLCDVGFDVKTNLNEEASDSSEDEQSSSDDSKELTSDDSEELSSDDSSWGELETATDDETSNSESEGISSDEQLSSDDKI